YGDASPIVRQLVHTRLHDFPSGWSELNDGTMLVRTDSPHLRAVRDSRCLLRASLTFDVNRPFPAHLACNTRVDSNRCGPKGSGRSLRGSHDAGPASSLADPPSSEAARAARRYARDQVTPS